MRICSWLLCLQLFSLYRCVWVRVCACIYTPVSYRKLSNFNTKAHLSQSRAAHHKKSLTVHTWNTWNHSVICLGHTPGQINCEEYVKTLLSKLSQIICIALFYISRVQCIYFSEHSNSSSRKAFCMPVYDNDWKWEGAREKLSHAPTRCVKFANVIVLNPHGILSSRHMLDCLPLR